MNAIDIFTNNTLGSMHWVWRNISFDVPWSENYFWTLTLLSLAIMLLEQLSPWRKQQKLFRRDFWLDTWYMYFNFFIFTIAISGFYALATSGFATLGIHVDSFTVINIAHWPNWAQLLLFFVLLDFLQWFTHRMLHRIPLLWRFHQVHHSIKEMGFAGHLRYHPMENLLYKPLKTLGVMIIGGFEPQHAFTVHFFTMAIGHLNHANLKIDYGVLKYIFNNPVMHLYHHAYALPTQYKFGVNFGISLSVWDYLFHSAYIPENEGKVRLGYPDDDKMPPKFFGQLLHGFKRQ